MNRCRYFFMGFVFLVQPLLLQARPILSESAPTLGKYYFETGASVWQRTDEFESPSSQLSTVGFPFWLKLGLRSNLDIGFTFLSASQTLERTDAKLKGSLTGRISPEIKYSLNDSWAFKTIWHLHKAEVSNETLPIGVGDDIEVKAIYNVATGWPLFVNAGFNRRGKYDSKMGVVSSPKNDFDPGDIFQTSAALEIPAPLHFSFLTEAAYYRVGDTQLNGRKISDTGGEAADVLLGLSWAYGGWDIRSGILFGLMDESHTSFDITRGAGDSTIRFEMSYRLKPSKPQR